MSGIRYPRKGVRPVRAARGFSLLELLVGIAMFALLSVIVLGGIRLGIQSWNAAAEKSADTEQMRIVHDLLRRQLTGTLALAVSRAGRWQLQFEGDPDSVRFVTELPDYVARGGAHMVTLTAEDDAEKKHLLLKWWPVHAADGADPQDDTVLLRDLSGFEISYFGALDRNARPQWRGDWRGVRHLPQLLKIAIRRTNGLMWPPLVVPLKVDAVSYYKSPTEPLENVERIEPEFRLPGS